VGKACRRVLLADSQTRHVNPLAFDPAGLTAVRTLPGATFASVALPTSPAPDVRHVYLLLGGNNLAKVNRGQATLEEVDKELRLLLNSVATAFPKATLLLAAPLPRADCPPPLQAKARGLMQRAMHDLAGPHRLLDHRVRRVGDFKADGVHLSDDGLLRSLAPARVAMSVRSQGPVAGEVRRAPGLRIAAPGRSSTPRLPPLIPDGDFIRMDRTPSRPRGDSGTPYRDAVLLPSMAPRSSAPDPFPATKGNGTAPPSILDLPLAENVTVRELLHLLKRMM
jgi:hypothetical protein